MTMELSLDRLYQINRRVILWAVFFGLLYLLRDFFTLIFLTFILAFFVYPAARFLIERLRFKRVAAISAVYLGIILGYAALLWWIAPNLAKEVGGLQRNLPEIEAKLKNLRMDLIEHFPGLTGVLDAYAPEEKIDEQLGEINGRINAYLPHVVTQAFTFAVTFLLAIVFGFLILMDFSRLALEIKRLKLSRLHDFYEQTAQPVVRFAYVVGRALQAQAVIACANTLLTLVGLVILKIPSLAMLSLIVFVCSFIPALGVFLSTTPIVLLALNYRGPGVAFFSIAFVCIVHAVEAYVLNPLIYGKHLKLNPVLVLIILFTGNHFFGVWGMLLGVPVAYYFLHDVFGVPVLSDRIGRSLASLPRSAPPPANLAAVEELGARIEKLPEAADR